jgi:hypothetical protein
MLMSFGVKLSLKKAEILDMSEQMEGSGRH